MAMDIKNPNAAYLVEAEERRVDNARRRNPMARRHGRVIIKRRKRVDNPEPLPEGGLTVERRRK